MRTITHVVGGRPWTDGATRHGDVYDPATGRIQAQVELASAADVDAAVGAAVLAAPAWRATSLAKRTQLLFAMREIVNARRDELAELITAEHGKVLADAAGEVQRGLEVIEYACGIGSQ